VLQSVKEERNILQTLKRWKANWIGHILRRNYFLNTLWAEKIRKVRSDGKTNKKR
jgi:hypothetical protein